MVLILCSTKNITSEHLLSANFTTHKYIFVLPGTKNLSRKNNSVYKLLSKLRIMLCSYCLVFFFYPRA